MHEDERYLIQRAQQGDAEAHATLYDRHYDAVYRFCYYRLSDPHLAQDITGEVFARMAEKLDTFRMRGRPLLAWLYTIARNLVTDAHRRNGKATLVPLSEASSIAADGEANPVRSVDQRQVIVLRFMEDYPNGQIACILGKSEGAVKSLQHRALKALRRALEREHCYEA
jgi:RNA polymerase sigma-70 factor (ECF subfamily)